MQPIGQVLDLIKSLARSCARHPFVVVLSVVVWLGAAVGFAASRGHVYIASMSVKAAEAQGADTQNLTLNLPGLSALSGTLPAYLKLLQSREVAQRLIDHDHIDALLFAGALDPAGNWKAPQDLLDRLLGTPRGPRPTADDVQARLGEMLVVNRDDVAGMASVSCTSADPTLCVRLLVAVHAGAEYQLGRIRLAEATRVRDYITKALPGITDAVMRGEMASALARADGEILRVQMQTPMGAILLEPPVAAPRPIAPRPGAILIAGLLFGLGAGVSIAWALGDGRKAARAAA